MSIMSSNSDSSLEKQRNWLELPCEVTLIILMKLPHLDILDYVQFVCKMWYNICKDPSMWRTIHIGVFDKPVPVLKLEKKAINAVDRSAGGLIDLNFEDFCSDELLSYVASRSNNLKRLSLASPAIISVKATTEAFAKLSSLEELELTLSAFRDEDAVPIINSCPFITTFKFNNVGSRNPYRASDVEALAIARSMPELRHLQLIGNYMTNVGLMAILDGCPHLQSLDMRACFRLDPDCDGNLWKRLSEQINDLRHPYDPTEDYKYHTTDMFSDLSDLFRSGFRNRVYDEYSSDNDCYYSDISD